MSAAAAEALKRTGNQYFQSGDWKRADVCYSQAIIQDPTNPAYFTNRALVRTRMEQWEAVIADCEKAIELLPSSLKAYTYLGAALLHLSRPTESFKASQRAYQLAITQRSPSISTIGSSCLLAKKAQWEALETQRLARESSLLGDLLPLLPPERRADLEAVFARAGEAARREVPEWLVDSITFNVMWDPVVTKHGHSYERATIMDHLRRSRTDPLTREPLEEAELRPNLALKSACEEFWRDNGWAVDW